MSEMFCDKCKKMIMKSGVTYGINPDSVCKCDNPQPKPTPTISESTSNDQTLEDKIDEITLDAINEGWFLRSKENYPNGFSGSDVKMIQRKAKQALLAIVKTEVGKAIQTTLDVMAEYDKSSDEDEYMRIVISSDGFHDSYGVKKTVKQRLNEREDNHE